MLGSIVIWLLFVLVIGLVVGSVHPMPTNVAYKKTNYNRKSVNTYGKYKQVKRYAGYARGRKMW